ncbi:MAG: hypothetical protein HY908_08270 [Myxococcales bacterium]|nr:hypothetical protein [Myxococcales bacterium]
MTDDLTATLRELTERLERLGIAYMVVGSVAALVHGRGRSTQDFDLVVALDEPSLRALLESLPAERFYVSPEAARDALRRRTMFNVIDLTTGWKVDVVPLKPRPFSAREFARRRAVSLLGVELFVATVEDTIVAKLEWSRLGGGSARQREDVRELVRLHADRLDREYLEAAVRELGLDDEWQRAREEER